MLASYDYDALYLDIQKRGVLVPILINEDTGEIVDGHHRMKIANKLGKEWLVERRRFESQEEAENVAIALNVKRGQLSLEQRKEIAVSLRDKEWSQQRIGDVLGVHKVRISRWLGDTTELQSQQGCIRVDAKLAKDHYPDRSISQLCEMPVEELAADDAVLFLWVTSPLLFGSSPIFGAWGFVCKASFVWDKEKHNVGHYNSVRHELILICTRGSCTPDSNKLHDSVVSIPRTKHSEKPEYFRQIIDH